jgi:hypothetical protein
VTVYESDNKDLSEILEKVLLNGQEKMKLFLKSQHEALYQINLEIPNSEVKQ